MMTVSMALEVVDPLPYTTAMPSMRGAEDCISVVGVLAPLPATVMPSASMETVQKVTAMACGMVCSGFLA